MVIYSNPVTPRKYKIRQVAVFIEDKFSAADTNSKNASITYQN